MDPVEKPKTLQPKTKNPISVVIIAVLLTVALPLFIWGIVNLTFDIRERAQVAGPDPKKTVLLINSDDYSQLETEVNQFKNDVMQYLNIEVEIDAINNLRNQTPDFVRNRIIEKCNPSPSGCEELEGAVFVGDVPYALYDQTYDENSDLSPFMFLYQDLDSTFEKNTNGHYFRYLSHGPHKGPEIYTAWIKPLKNSDLGSEIEQMRSYFDKHHRFMSGQLQPTQKGVFAIHCPTPPHERVSQLVTDLYGEENIVDIFPSECDQECQLNDVLTQELVQMPEVAYIHSHGSNVSIWCYDNIDFQNLGGHPLFLLTWGCTNGNFHLTEERNLMMSFINGSEIGLSSLSKLEDDDIISNDESGRFVNNQWLFFEEWRKGKHVGRAWLDTMQRMTNLLDPWNEDSTPVNLYEVSGPLQRIIIGSPFVYSKLALSQQQTPTPSPPTIPSPTPTVSPSPSPSPSPDPNSPDTFFQVLFKFKGVSGTEAQGSKITVKILNGADPVGTTLPALPVAYEGNGIYKFLFSVPENLPQRDDYFFFIKGEKHLSTKFCRNNQDNYCPDTQAGQISLPVDPGQIVTLDFTNVPLEPGDVLPQDGIANLLDFERVRALLNKPCSELSVQDKLVGDLDYSGCVNVRDLILIRQTLETKHEQS